MTRRQEQLLTAIINEFIDTASAVGSVSLTDKYQFNVSPATVRNEMAELVRQGFLRKPHSSAGRIPTSMGLRYFVQQLIEEFEEPDIVTKQNWKQQLHAKRFEKEKLIRNALKFLTEISGNASVALIGEEVYYSGLSDILNIPEFQELDKLRNLMLILEDYSKLQTIFQQTDPAGNVKVLIGKETGINSFEDYAVVFNNISLHGRTKGYISIIGPNRMNYSKIIPAVQFISDSISDVVKGW